MNLIQMGPNVTKVPRSNQNKSVSKLRFKAESYRSLVVKAWARLFVSVLELRLGGGKTLQDRV
jgi:hypothetical protein